MSQTENAQFSGTGVATESDSFTAPFPSMGRPDAGTGELTVRQRKTQSDAVTAFIELRQGTNVIASRTVSPTTSFTDYSLGLTANDVGRLTTGACNLADLTVRVSFGVTVDCCPNPLPTTLVATIETGLGLCSDLNGETIVLTWNPTGTSANGAVTGVWEGTSTWDVEGEQVSLIFYCGNDENTCNGLQLDVACGIGSSTSTPLNCVCDLLEVEFSTFCCNLDPLPVIYRITP